MSPFADCTEHQSSSVEGSGSVRFPKRAILLAIDAVQPEGHTGTDREKRHSPMKPKRTLGARPFPQSFRKCTAYEITGRHTDESTEARLGDCRPDKKWRLHSKSHLTRLLSESTRTVIQSHETLIEIAGAYMFVLGDFLKRSMTNDVSRDVDSPGKEILKRFS